MRRFVLVLLLIGCAATKKGKEVSPSTISNLVQDNQKRVLLYILPKTRKLGANVVEVRILQSDLLPLVWKNYSISHLYFKVEDPDMGGESKPKRLENNLSLEASYCHAGLWRHKIILKEGSLAHETQLEFDVEVTP